MTKPNAIEELDEEVRIDAAMVRAREVLVSRIDDMVRHLKALGFTRITLTRDPTGMLILTIDPEAISILTNTGPVFRSARAEDTDMIGCIEIGRSTVQGRVRRTWQVCEGNLDAPPVVHAEIDAGIGVFRGPMVRRGRQDVHEAVTRMRRTLGAIEEMTATGEGLSPDQAITVHGFASSALDT